MSPVGALLAAFNQLFLFIHTVRRIVQDPVLQFTASIFNFGKDDLLSLHPGLDACGSETGQGERFSLIVKALAQFSVQVRQGGKISDQFFCSVSLLVQQDDEAEFGGGDFRWHVDANLAALHNVLPAWS